MLAALSHDISLAIRQVENIGLVYALVKGIACNGLNKRYDFIFDNPLSDEAFNQLVIEVPKSALKNVKLNQIKNVLTSQIYNGVYGFMGGKQWVASMKNKALGFCQMSF
ncbi:hypothetical protein MPG37_02385 [Helicobacter pylori]|uniref:hypothetical protein n=1 Tax=Helicobacter pylori TaxID=210 RepID=UPI001FD18A76|nr:hypothetical protein [Helicobacter pylori]UOR35452.1 hypothetical protein MPG37_02385 [Helicobacter pylori]